MVPVINLSNYTKKDDVPKFVLVLLKTYGYITISQFLRFTIWVFCSYWYLKATGFWVFLFSADAGENGVAFFFNIFTVYLIRGIINYMYHVFFQKSIHFSILQSEYGDKNNASSKNAKVHTLRKFLRDSNLQQINEYLISQSEHGGN